MALLDQLPLNALRAFEAAGRHDSFRAAADELGVSQGTVAQHVRGLEERLSTPLFERHARGVRLTVAGARMHDRLTRAFQGMEDAVAELSRTGVGVRLSVPCDLAEGWLAPLGEALGALHPDVSVEFLTPGTAAADLEIVECLATTGAKTGAASGDMSGGRVSRRLFGSECVAVATPEALREAQSFASVRLLHDPRDLWPDYCEKVLGMPRPQRLGGLGLDGGAQALRAALDGRGVALLERVAVAGAIADGRLKQVEPGALRLGTEYRITAEPAALQRADVAAVLEFIATEAAKMDGALRGQAGSKTGGGPDGVLTLDDRAMVDA